jgi:hypothetical protein
MPTYLEHANITVPDIDAAIRFLKLVDPEFVVRHKGYDKRRWAHFGNDRFYVALEEPEEVEGALRPARPYQDYGVNHLGWVVENFDVVVARLETAGFRQGIDVEPHPFRKRAYYFDEAGFEWEILEYLSENPSERNSYA